MRIIIVTQKEPFFIPKVLNSIIETWKNYIDFILFLKPDEFKNKINSLFYYLQFWGFKQSIKFGKKLLNLIIKKNLNLNGVEILENINVNTKDFIDRAKNVDYIISIASNQIFKEEVLNAPKEMCLNIHAGLLPRYKGYNPSFWVLYNNEEITGVTLHKMEKDLDNGSIIKQEIINIQSNETWYSLQNRVAVIAGNILINILPNLIKKDFKIKEQIGEGSIFRKPKTVNGKEFRRRGKRFI